MCMLNIHISDFFSLCRITKLLSSRDYYVYIFRFFVITELIAFFSLFAIYTMYTFQLHGYDALITPHLGGYSYIEGNMLLVSLSILLLAIKLNFHIISILHTSMADISRVFEFIYISVLPVLSFLLIQYHEFTFMSISFTDSFAFSLFYSLLSLHFIHVVLGLLFMLLIPYTINNIVTG